MPLKKRWQTRPEPPQAFFDEHPELPKTVAALLYHRGIRSQEKIDEFLSPDFSKHIHDPFLFQDMQKTVDRIFSAIEQDEKIIIHGDYDADGVSASTILYDVLTAIGTAHVDVFLPHREIDGYGLNLNTVDTLHKEGTKLIITCDCGISNVEAVAQCNTLGIDVIITDHHSIPQTLPEAYAIVHPKIATETYPDKDLAGGGVAYKLMQALLQKHKEAGKTLTTGDTHEQLEKWSLDMAAIASVADMVPLIGESRTLTKYGLIVLGKTRRIGLKKMYQEAGITDTNDNFKKEITADTIGFQLAPRINAAGRMNHANVAYKLMTTSDPIAATDLAYELEQNNKDRQKLTEDLTKRATDQVEHSQMDQPVLFILGEGWPTGIVGLIASRIKEKYQKPTIVMAKNPSKHDSNIMDITGSGRSIAGFDMIASLQSMPEMFQKFGGHPMACGFTLTSSDHLEGFKTALTDKYNTVATDTDLSPTIDIDALVDLEDIHWELYDLLEKFEPFGQANPSPTYQANGLTVVSVKPLGKTGSHIQLMVKHHTHKLTKLIGWGFCSDSRGDGTNWCERIKSGDLIDVVFDVGVNEWNGHRELQLKIVDLRMSDKTESDVYTT